MIGPDAVILDVKDRVVGFAEYKTTSRERLYTQASFSGMEIRMAAQFAKEKDEFEPEDIRMDLNSKRLVRLVKSHYTEDELFDMEDTYHMPWVVEDVLSGEIYTRLDVGLSDEVFNAMETLGWASDEHPDTEIAGD